MITDRRRLLAGAAVVAGAWSVPAITTIDSAAAVGTCAPGTLDWDVFALGTVFSSTIVNGVTVTLSVTALPNTTLLATNRTIRAPLNGSVNQRAVQFQQLPNGVGRGQDVTFTFSAAVSNISFTMYDIDNLAGGWGDRVQMLTSGYTYSPAVTSGTGRVIGNGTATGTTNTTGPFRNNNTNLNYGDGSNNGNVTITYAGPITAFSFRYTNAANTGGGNQRIAVSDISWSC
jgi:hypothetical protein